MQVGHLTVESTCTAPSCGFWARWCLWCCNGLHGGGRVEYDRHQVGEHAGMVRAGTP